jgi:hypothetical protein
MPDLSSALRDYDSALVDKVGVFLDYNRAYGIVKIVA